jgi:acylphosphatase
VTDGQQQLHAIIQGRVQGVSFRYYTMRRAAELALIGWVRNLPDGTVEVLAVGTRSQLDSLVTFLHHGPSGARVDSLQIDWQQATDQFNDFSIG